MSTWGVVVAAGRGERAGLGRNKVFHSFGGRSLLARCLDALSGTGLFDGLALVISPEDEAAWQELCRTEGPFPLVRAVAHGGATRRHSVYSGLKALPEDCDIVAIHDAARPFVTREVVLATLESARRYGSGVISTPVVDTIKIVAEDGSVATPDRRTLRAVQTPQSFDRRRIMEAHARALREDLAVTDDAMLFEHYYGELRLVTAPGAERNTKLTTKADFDMLERRIPAMRVGHGYDAHRLVEGRDLVLCGVTVPHRTGLDGHSDADVAVHALMDALLGALGLGDIGRHFPDSDPQYKGISSMLLLEKVMGEVRKAGFAVVNADVTIVAQRPKLLPYLDAMRDNIAVALGVPSSQVNVKATTTERMGFEGEEQGISAQAVALLMEQ